MCSPSEPVSWSNASACRGVPGCVAGDLPLCQQDSMVVRCPANEGRAFRCFNRSTTLGCLEALRERSGRPDGGGRLLLVGVSVMRHVWYAMGADDVYADSLRESKACVGFEHQLRSFEPHLIHYMQWQVVTNTTAVHHKVSASCVSRGAVGGRAPYSALGWAARVARAEPYDAVAIMVGAWDAAFTGRDAAGFEAGLEAGVAEVRAAWPAARLVLLTSTPSGGVLPRCPQEACFKTPAAASAFVGTVNAAVARVAARHAPAAVLLDAHQMVESHPSRQVAGYPPGLWDEESRGWHFARHANKQKRAEERARAPPSMAGEMYRAIANRIYDAVCPPDRPAAAAPDGQPREPRLLPAFR